jgi:hypothetical protein
MHLGYYAKRQKIMRAMLALAGERGTSDEKRSRGKAFTCLSFVI